MLASINEHMVCREVEMGYAGPVEVGHRGAQLGESTEHFAGSGWRTVGPGFRPNEPGDENRIVPLAMLDQLDDPGVGEMFENGGFMAESGRPGWIRGSFDGHELIVNEADGDAAHRSLVP